MSNNSKIKVSVCVQTYQHNLYIKKCLDGILMQKTNFQFEIILGEDESVDGTREICVEYAKKYSDKIRLFLRNRKDVIIIGERVTGRFNLIENLRSAKGKYIALCEGDDFWTDPFKLQKQFDFLEKNEDYGLCASRATVMYENVDKNSHINYMPIQKKYYTSSDLLYYVNFIKTTTTFFKKESINIEDPLFRELPVGDLYLWLNSSRDKKIKILEEEMACYRVNSGSIWMGIDEVKRNENYILFLQLFLEKGNLKQEDRKLCKRRIKLLHRENKWIKFRDKKKRLKNKVKKIIKFWM